MGKAKGIKLRRKLVKVLGCLLQRDRQPRKGHRRLQKLWNWLMCLGHDAWRVCQGKRKAGYIRLGQERAEDSDHVASVPKGYLAVYVGEKDDDTCRVLVPVMYLNHPLFDGLLLAAEMVYGFDYPGGKIQIPCGKSEFEDVRKRIAAAKGGNGCRGERETIAARPMNRNKRMPPSKLVDFK